MAKSTNQTPTKKVAKKAVKTLAKVIAKAKSSVKKSAKPKTPVKSSAKKSVTGSAKKSKISDSNKTSFKLRSGDKMPAVGYGCWKVDNKVCTEMVYKALKAGYRCIDQAAIYGNEAETGVAITKAINDGILTRKDLWVTSKLWNTMHKKEHVKEACKRSIKDLNVGYLDLYLIHFPISMKYVPLNKKYPAGFSAEDRTPLHETWKAMEELVKEGLVRNIGISNYGVAQMMDLLSYAKVKPAVLQVELHPYLTQENLIKFCHNEGIAVTAYSSFGAPSYVPMGLTKLSESCLEDPVIKSIAKAVKKTPGQVALKWAVQRGTAVIPKSSNDKRIAENHDLFSFSLTEKQMAAISNLNKNKRFNSPTDWNFPGLFVPIFN